MGFNNDDPGKENEQQNNTSRRSLLGAIGIGAMTVGTVPTLVSAEEEPELEIEPVTIEADTSHHPAVERAIVSIKESGAVSKKLYLDSEVLNSRDESSRYFLDLVPPSGPSADVENVETFSAKVQQGGVEHAETLSLSPSSSAGIPDIPDPGLAEGVYYGNTESQECGALARSNVFYWDPAYSYDTETVDGDACEGEEWDSTFALFCDALSSIGVSCQVPSAFDTTWHERERVDGGYWGGTINTMFECTDFPGISETVASAHEVEADNGTVQWSCSHVAVEEFNWSDLNIDSNGIANAATDIGYVLADYHPLGSTLTKAWTHIVVSYILSDSAGYVSG